MRIDDKLPSRNVAKKSQKDGSRKGEVVSNSLFAASLTGMGDKLTNRAVELEELKREIDMAGDSLERDPSMANYKSFRELLAMLAKKVTAEAYKVELLGGTPGAPAYHEVIRVIDSHADSLYRMIVSEQKDRIKIAAKIEQIKGLVLSFRL
ncbi:hypothetical protein OR1_02094 [Geobacter sp. OR-1]|uniref:YaaR family protein n=1 Tax=Geobacter sp. OR-1 TaxID=1266765 RepID=UPI000542E655|nr:YaaR family protein [Geobacter sp. OR-1]GAM09812.1 hypothetical protein OR1_02094 [Geobacter sp. OR-1]